MVEFPQKLVDGHTECKDYRCRDRKLGNVSEWQKVVNEEISKVI